MDVVLLIMLFLLSFVILILSSEFTVRYLSKFSDELNLSTFVVASIILALGTSLPELASSIAAQVSKVGNLAFGIIIGSNISNLCFILGFIFLLTRKKYIVTSTEIKSIFFSIIPLFLLIFFSLNGLISRIEGLLFILLYVSFNIWNYSVESKRTYKKIKFNPVALLTLLFIAFGITGIVISSKFLVEYAIDLSTIFGISPAVIGLLVIAFGTSVPELASSITASLKGKNEIAVGNIIGSNITNILLIVGITAVIFPIKIALSSFILPLIIAVLSTASAFIYIQHFKVFDHKIGGALLLIYALFIFSLII